MRLHDMGLKGNPRPRPFRRASWPAGLRIEHIDCGPTTLGAQLCDGELSAPWTPSVLEFLADDWEWYEGPRYFN